MFCYRLLLNNGLSCSDSVKRQICISKSLSENGTEGVFRHSLIDEFLIDLCRQYFYGIA